MTLFGSMLETLPSSSDHDHPSQAFSGVRFALCGFNPVNDQKVRSKLVNGGGTDVGLYDPSCTHVIVDKLVYDDPICVTARKNGKTVVNGLWVDHSFDIGMPVDHTSVMYQPLRDLNGIPGAASLVVCLTGYQRHDRDDIMTMVGLMGANFSKPLVANKVTHLICYKFEGEKYELAKKMKKIKLVNHRWLEDCLRAWEILPETNYDKSGYEMEMMEAEAEAKDSEEEPDTEIISKNQKQNVGNNVNVSPRTLQSGIARTHQSPTLKKEDSRNMQDVSVSKGSSDVCISQGIQLSTGKNITSEQKSSLPIMHAKICDMPVSSDSRTLRDVTCGEPSNRSFKSHESKDLSTKLGNGVPSTSRSTKRTPPSGKFDISTGFDLDKFENAKNRFDSVFDVGAPRERTEVLQEEGLSYTPRGKKKLDLSSGSSKIQKMSLNSKGNSEGSSLSRGNEVLEPSLLINRSLDINNHLSDVHDVGKDKTVSPLKFSTYCSKELPLDNSLSKTITSETRQDYSADKAPQSFYNGLEKASSASTAGVLQNIPQDIEVPSPRTKTSDIAKSKSSADVEVPKGEKADSLPKPFRKKMIAKKRSGSRPKLGSDDATTNKKGSIYLDKTVSPKNAVKQTSEEDRSVNPNERGISPPAVAITSSGMKTNDILYRTVSMDDETEAPEDKEVTGFDPVVCEVPGVVEAAPAVDVMTEEKSEGDGKNNQFDESIRKENHTEEKIVEKKKDQASKIKRKTASLVKGTRKVKKGVYNEEPEHEKKDKKPEFSKRSVLCSEGKTNQSLHTNMSENSVEVEKERTPIDVRDDQSACHSEKVEKVPSKSKKTPKKRKLNKVVDKEEAKHDLHTEGKTKRTLSTKKPENSVELEKENMFQERSEKVEKVPSKSEKTPIMRKLNKVMDKEDAKHDLHPEGKTNSTVSTKELESSVELEKENIPEEHSKKVEKVPSKSKKTPTKRKGGEIDDGVPMQVERMIPSVKCEPVCFIVSGHRLQRKEFQQVIRRLKGRVCRDSHQWSYQATHFIVPDPIRRTEKFFAAAASGRWILKTDYLTASNQAGRFLDEEPYEWHGNGLNEDGAISLQAPRKWRLLRERTGHGAFYGMRIVIYGDCIAPPLETLKRAVKAGDGTILATSPPYTRYLDSGVDFAIVSAGMPRVDIWVQEFLKHEIPCVVADYLVEYVCKPGYPLDKHVQFNTHSWVKRSFANLQRRAEEIVEVQTSSASAAGNRDDTDLQCEVCGSTERGEVMLICGDERGTTGCGTGTHIDCCDPPLESVPEGDWFCRKCSIIMNKDNTSSGAKKGLHQVKKRTLAKKSK